MADTDKISLIPHSPSKDAPTLTPVTSLQSDPLPYCGKSKPIINYKDLAEKVKSNPKPYKRKQYSKPPKKSCCKFLLRLLFSHLGLFLLVCAYSAFGAWLFIQIELPYENQQRQLKDIKALEINDTMTYMADVFWYWQDQNYSYDEWVIQVRATLKTFELYVIDSSREYKYNGSYGTWVYDWEFSNSLLYSVNLITTIGYGNITPKTHLGMIASIVYAVIGISLLVLFLASVGGMMAKAVKYTYSRLCCRWCRSKRKISEYRKGDDTIIVPRDYMRLANEHVGLEEYMPTTEVMVPILLCLGIVALYIVVGSVIFSRWEGWDFTTATYFTFMTISTTGLGDYVPGRSFLDYKDGFTASMRMLFTCFYCALGMALVSMGITLMQEQIKAKIKWAAIEIGLVKSDEQLKKEQEKLLASS